MNTAVAQALIAAGIKPKPLKERVWLWLKDHPDHMGTSVSKALQESEQSVASALADMTSRGMLVREQTRSMRRNIKVWIYKAVGDTYTVLPRAKDPQPRKWRPTMSSSKTPPIGQAPATIAIAKHPPVEPNPDTCTRKISVQEIVDGMTVSEAREMHTYLNSLFGK